MKLLFEQIYATSQQKSASRKADLALCLASKISFSNAHTFTNLFSHYKNQPLVHSIKCKVPRRGKFVNISGVAVMCLYPHSIFVRMDGRTDKLKLTELSSLCWNTLQTIFSHFLSKCKRNNSSSILREGRLQIILGEEQHKTSQEKQHWKRQSKRLNKEFSIPFFSVAATERGWLRRGCTVLQTWEQSWNHMNKITVSSSQRLC